VDYQVAVIGAGPGGYVAALQAARRGKKVCLIERAEVGGICLNWGCIPTKTLVASAKVFSLVQKAGEYGIAVGQPSVDWSKVRERQAGVVKRLVNGVLYLLQQHQVELIRGAAVFRDPHRLGVTGVDGAFRELTAEQIIIATGSAPQIPARFPYDGRRVITSDEALALERLPESLVIVGGGVIGCEFASIMAAFGVKVTIVEMLESLIPNLDREVSASLRLQLKKKGIAVLTGAAVQEVRVPTGTEAGPVQVSLADGQTLAAEKLLVAIGRRPNSRDLGLEGIGVTVAENGRIPVNEQLQTNLPWIYAIGDVNDQPWDLAHAASFQGSAAARHLAGESVRWRDELIPNCIFTEPEVAAVGLSLEEATARGIAATVGKFAFLANGKAQAQGEAAGFVKVVAETGTGRLLGVQIIGPGASDLIAEAALAIKNGLTAAAVAATVHAHPTLAEAFYEACESLAGQQGS
jgi:dihydrolipoamide dehydrogenase